MLASFALSKASALDNLKSRIVLGASVIILSALLASYLYVTNLQEQNKLLEAQKQSQDIVINSYAENALITRQIQEKNDKTIVSNRVARDKRIEQLNNEKTLMKRRLDEINNECLGAKLPDSILDSLRTQ